VLEEEEVVVDQVVPQVKSQRRVHQQVSKVEEVVVRDHILLLKIQKNKLIVRMQLFKMN
jgi:hypothetical protein